MFDTACRRADLWMAAHSAGRLEPAEGLRLQDHLDRCPHCRARRERLSSLVGLLRSESPALPEARLAMMERAMRQAPVTMAPPVRAMSAPPRWALAAAVLLAAAFAFAAAKVISDSSPKGAVNDVSHERAPEKRPAASAPAESKSAPLRGEIPKEEPPHHGRWAKVGPYPVEVTVDPKGELRLYPYSPEREPISTAEVSIPELELGYAKKSYKVKLSPEPGGTYLVGRVEAPLSVPAEAELSISSPAPVKIRGEVYGPELVFFPAYAVVAPIVVVAHPAAVIVEPIEIGVGVKVGPPHGHAYGHYKHSHKHSH